MVGLIGSGIIKDFGPMKKAEERAMNEGKVLRDGAVPLIGKELTEMKPYEGIKPRIFLNSLLLFMRFVSVRLLYMFLDSAVEAGYGPLLLLQCRHMHPRSFPDYQVK